MRLKLGAFCCNMQITIAIGDYKSDQNRSKKNQESVARSIIQAIGAVEFEDDLWIGN